MGGCACLQSGGEDPLQVATRRAAGRLGELAVSSRYHRLPRKLKDDYLLESTILGSGSSGQVQLARSRHKDCGERRFAAKCLRLAGASCERRKELAAEVEVFLAMDHPHVVRLLDAYESDKQLSLIMECLTGGDLLRRAEEKRFSDSEAAGAVYQMLLTINYLHSQSIAHRDVKLENFLYESPGSDRLKLIDFGLSHILEGDAKMNLSCGTLSYMAPEVLDKKSYTSQCDLWSLGVSSFMLVFGYLPFAGSEKGQVQSIKAAKFKVRRSAHESASPAAEAFVRALIVVDPTQRLTAEGALAHPWMAQCTGAPAAAPRPDVAVALRDFGRSSALARAGLLAAAWQLGVQERSKLSEEFLKIDVGRAGIVGKAQFMRLFEDHLQTGGDAAEDIFRALDVHGDGQMHYSAFLAAMMPSHIGLTDDLVKAVFRRFDVGTHCSADALIDLLGQSFGKDEVRNALGELGPSQDGLVSHDKIAAHLRGAAPQGVADCAAIAE